MDRTEVIALPSDETLALLESLGVLDAYNDGALVCAVCAAPLKDAGMAAARQSGDGVAFCCPKLDCLEEFNRSA